MTLSFRDGVIWRAIGAYSNKENAALPAARDLRLSGSEMKGAALKRYVAHPSGVNQIRVIWARLHFRADGG